MRLRLVRRWFEGDRTLGELYAGSEWIAYTMEPGNQDESERVPEGFYYLEPHGWEQDTQVRFKKTWALIGEHVSHQQVPGIARSAVVFHQGRRDEHTLACPLLGLSIGRSQREPSIEAGAAAMDKLRKYIGTHTAFLTITEAR